MVKRNSNKKAWESLKQKHSDYILQAGWFEESKYSNGTPIGGIAAVQNYGAVINQNVSEKQRAFLHYLGIHLKKATQTLHIVIPATHFMENCQNKNKEKWRKLIQDGWTSVFIGNIEPDKAMDMIAQQIAGDIAKEIANGDYPPDKPSTVQAKQNRYADKKTKGDLDKRLIDTGLMLDSILSKVTKK